MKWNENSETAMICEWQIYQLKMWIHVALPSYLTVSINKPDLVHRPHLFYTPTIQKIN